MPNFRLRVLVATGAVLVVSLLAWIVFGEAEHGGDLATWVTAVATLGALIAAAYAASEAARLYQLETDRDERRAEEARAEQAREITAWYLPMDNKVQIWNSSRAAVTNVVVSVTWNAFERAVAASFDIQVLPPSEAPIARSLMPDAEFEVERDVIDAAGRDARLIFEFTDALGNRWRRTPTQFMRVVGLTDSAAVRDVLN